jgi:hypothetical protein
MNKSWIRLGAGGAGLIAAFALAAAPAIASPPGTVQSKYFGGYDVTPAGGISSAGSTFRMPTITCPDTSEGQVMDLGEWINNSAGDLFQPGGLTDVVSDGVLTCGSGTAFYEIEAGSYSSLVDELAPAGPGDLIQTRVEELAGGNAIATTTDLTTGQQVSTEDASDGQAVQIYEGAIPIVSQERPGDASIPKFKSVTFTRSQVGGLPLSQLEPVPTALDQDGPVQISPGAISAKHPGQFVTTEKSDR